MRVERNPSLRRLFGEALVIVAAAAVLGLGFNLFNPRGYEPVPRRSLSYRAIVPLSAEAAKLKYDAGIARFIDAREEEEYGDARVAGAISVPALGNDLPPSAIAGREPVVYCGAAECGVSEILARRMIDAGHRGIVYVLDGGLSEWDRRGYPMERGK